LTGVDVAGTEDRCMKPWHCHLYQSQPFTRAVTLADDWYSVIAITEIVISQQLITITPTLVQTMQPCHWSIS